MKVSVIVPVYNVEKYVLPCLQSVKDQTLEDFECLIIDDGSPDNSIDIASKLIADDSRFVIHHKENGGLSDALPLLMMGQGFGDGLCEGLFDEDIEEDVSEDDDK